jgi:hypothetical protein
VIGTSNDPLEHEADRIADLVTATPRNSAVGGMATPIQRSTGQSADRMPPVPASVDQVLADPGAPLDPALREEVEQRFRYDFSRVRVHSGARAERSARDVNAHAYTVGPHIVFGTGRFAPGTPDGRRLIAHELTHVVQQRAAPEVLQRKPASDAPDAQAQAIIDAAKDDKTTPDAGKRAVDAVWAILKTYYPGEAANVSEVVFNKDDPGLTTSPVGSGAKLTGKIVVGTYFLDNIDSFARRVLQVGHELQHVDQQRAGMGGAANQNKREFLAFAWEALQQPKAGTGRLAFAMQRGMIDCALGHLNCLSSEEQKSFDTKRTELMKRRDEVNGKGGNPPTDPPTGCKPCSLGRQSAPPAQGAKGASAPSGKVTTQPTPTQVTKADAKKSPTDDEDKPKIEFSAAAGGEVELSGKDTEPAAKLSFEASFPLGSLIAPDALKTRPLLGGAPLKFFDEFSLEPSFGLKQGDAAHPMLTPIAIEGSLKMVSIEWERLTRAGAFKVELGIGAVGSAEYTPQSEESKFELGGEAGGELEYRRKKESGFFIKVEAKGQGKFTKAGDAKFEWEGASFSVGAKLGYSF